MKGLTSCKTSPIRMYAIIMMRKNWFFKRIAIPRRYILLPCFAVLKKLSQKRSYKMKHFVSKTLKLLLLEFSILKHSGGKFPLAPPPSSCSYDFYYKSLIQQKLKCPNAKKNVLIKFIIIYIKILTGERKNLPKKGTPLSIDWKFWKFCHFFCNNTLSSEYIMARKLEIF